MNRIIAPATGVMLLIVADCPAQRVVDSPGDSLVTGASDTSPLVWATPPGR